MRGRSRGCGSNNNSKVMAAAAAGIGFPKGFLCLYYMREKEGGTQNKFGSKGKGERRHGVNFFLFCVNNAGLRG